MDLLWIDIGLATIRATCFVCAFADQRIFDSASRSWRTGADAGCRCLRHRPKVEFDTVVNRTGRLAFDEGERVDVVIFTEARAEIGWAEGSGLLLFGQ